MKTLNSDIKSKKFHRAYLLYGNENYLLKNYKFSFKKAIAGNNEMNYEYFEGKSADISRFIDALMTAPFFAEKRCIIAEDTSWFKTSPERVVDFIEKLPSSSVVIFIEREVDKKSRLYKKIAEIGYLAELDHLKKNMLRNWAAGILGRAGKKITVANMDLFLSCTGDDMERISNELEKLIAYKGEEEVIESADIESIVTVNIEDKIFEMVEAAASKRINEAMKRYKDLLLLKEAPKKMFLLTAKQFSRLLALNEALKAGASVDEMAKILQIKQFNLVKLKKEAENFDTAELEKYVKRCAEIEEGMNTGNIPETLAAELIITMP